MLKKLLAAALLCFGLHGNAFAAQGSGCMPTIGTVSGLTYSGDVNSGLAALISSNSGATPPATDCSAAPVKGQVWLDTSVTPNLWRIFDGISQWLIIGALDTTNHLWAPPIGGGVATMPSAATVDLWSINASAITITGTTQINALAASSAVPGTIKFVSVTSPLILTHDPVAMPLPGGGNINALAGDRFLAVALSGNNIAVTAYTRADGTALINPAIPLGTVSMGDFGTIPAKTVWAYGQALSRASYPAYFAAVTRAQSGTTNNTTTISGVPNTAGFAPGMPVEGVGIPVGTLISSVTASTVVMNAAATNTGTQTFTTLLTGYGSGGNATTTIGVKDCRGRTLAGRDDMNFASANNLTAAQFGTGRNYINGNGGGESFQLGVAHIPSNITATGSNSITLTSTVGDIFYAPSGLVDVFDPGPNVRFAAGFTAFIGQMVASGSVGITSTSNNTGNAPYRTVQPTVLAECVVQVLP